MAAARRIPLHCLASSLPAPAVRAFLQLASHRPHAILDFLAPAAAATRTYPQTPAARHPLRPLPKPYSPRTFSTTSIRKETVAIHNPRKDDDGKDMAVEITPRASNRLKEIMSQDSNPNLALRITVESGGCHGFQYLMSLTTLPPGSQGIRHASSSSSDVAAASSVASDAEEEAGLDEDDTVFKATDGSEAKVVMDGPSLELLKGSKIDYTVELIGSQFKIVDNPLATSSCGCGTSFDIKI